MNAKWACPAEGIPAARLKAKQGEIPLILLLVSGFKRQLIMKLKWKRFSFYVSEENDPKLKCELNSLPVEILGALNEIFP